MEIINFINSMAYTVAIPIFFALLLLEVYFGHKNNQQSHELKDSVVSITSGLVFVGIGAFTKTIKILVFFWIYENFRLTTIDYTWWVGWVILFVLEDFTFYWGHRMGHLVAFYWASHVVHHSSQKYNLSTAMRKTWTYDFTGHFLLWCWLPFVGFHPLQLLAVSTLSFIYQYWIHTEKIGFMPKWYEYVFNTPSHHRVHHSSNFKYLDSNFGGVLILFDRLFGTYAHEEEKCVYGLRSNINTNNIFKVEFHKWIDLWKTVLKNKNSIVAIQYLIKAPGWSHDGSTLTTKQLRAKRKQS